MKIVDTALIGRDAELRDTKAGHTVCNLSLAFKCGRKDASTGKTPTQWVDAALWGKRAEAMAQYLTKGTRVHVVIEDGRLETFVRTDGTPGAKIIGNIIAIDLLGSPQQSTAPSPAPRPAPAPRPPAASSPPAFDDMDDDIPF